MLACMATALLLYNIAVKSCNVGLEIHICVKGEKKTRSSWVSMQNFTVTR